jgi:hypothetical protein
MPGRSGSFVTSLVPKRHSTLAAITSTKRHLDLAVGTGLVAGADKLQLLAKNYLEWITRVAYLTPSYGLKLVKSVLPDESTHAAGICDVQRMTGMPYWGIRYV